MIQGTRTRGLRWRLILAVLGAVTVGVALLVTGFNLVLDNQLDGDLNGLLKARAQAQLGTLAVTDGKLTVGEAPDEGNEAQVWIFAGSKALERPRRTSPTVDSAAVTLAGGPRRFLDVSHPAVRLLAVPVRSTGRQIGTVVVAASRAPYERTARTALIASLVLAVVLVVAVGLIARWLLGCRAAAGGAHDRRRRRLERARPRPALLARPPTDELTTLAATLDGLLDRLAAGMRREQRLSSEMSHELRTPLAKISTQAQLLAGAPELPADLREEADGIVRAANAMREVIDVLMSAARAESDATHGTADVSSRRQRLARLRSRGGCRARRRVRPGRRWWPGERGAGAGGANTGPARGERVPVRAHPGDRDGRAQRSVDRGRGRGRRARRAGG